MFVATPQPVLNSLGGILSNPKHALEISEFFFPQNDLFPFEKHVSQAALRTKGILKKIATLGLRAA